jgi:hypothetical protein
LVLAWLAARELFRSRQLTKLIPLIIGAGFGFALAAPAWLALLDSVQGSARSLQESAAHFQWLVPWSAWPGLILPSWTVKWLDFSSRLVSHSATELACGLIPVPAIVAALMTKRRGFLQRTKWDLLLLVSVALLAMIPTAGVFRWSFRWLPLFHLVLALCAAERLRLTTEDTEIAEEEIKTKSSVFSLSSVVQRPASVGLMLLLVLVLAARFFGFAGEHLFPLGWILIALSMAWLLSGFVQSFREWSPVAIAWAALLATYLCIPPNCGVPKYNFAQSLLQPEPLDRHRLYLSLYPPPEYAYRVEAHLAPAGQTVRPGSTSLWAALRFVNGYSPIRPAGVAREFATAIHGEIDPHMGEWLAESEARSDGLLERLGIDGIIVARDFQFAPQPASEWQVVVGNDEGNVYHRRGNPIPAVRSVEWDGRSTHAVVGAIADLRNAVSASVQVPAGEKPALLAFSRPYFRGYRAYLEGRELPVTSFRSLIPLVEVPAGASGRITLVYRPMWLVYGSGIALIAAIVWIAGAIAALLDHRS